MKLGLVFIIWGFRAGAFREASLFMGWGRPTAAGMGAEEIQEFQKFFRRFAKEGGNFWTSPEREKNFTRVSKGANNFRLG